MANYNFMDESTSPATNRGTLSVTFVSGPGTPKLTNVSYTNNTGSTGAQNHGDIVLSGPDANGNYTGDKQFNNAFDVTGHSGFKHISFTFNPTNPAPNGAFTNGSLNNDPGTDDGFDWTASAGNREDLVEAREDLSNKYGA